jgi:hypothetical protein
MIGLWSIGMMVSGAGGRLLNLRGKGNQETAHDVIDDWIFWRHCLLE